MAVNKNDTISTDLLLHQLGQPDIQWYWVDFNAPTEEEAMLLEQYFHFHPLAIEDCLHLLQRPKMDHYDDLHFLVLHAMNQQTLAAEEVDLFIGKNFIVTFHLNDSKEIADAWQRTCEQQSLAEKGHLYAAYIVMDELVDQYFPAVYQLEDQLAEFESDNRNFSTQALMNEIFDIRAKLLKLRKTIFPMRELLYRIINSESIEGLKEHLVYFMDINDHLLKLTEMIESNREMTADMRDSYISMNSDRMNTIMKTLTVITTIFMPLTFIAGVYGMNFANMPELKWNWGYFAVLGIMISIGISMFLWFRQKRWFD